MSDDQNKPIDLNNDDRQFYEKYPLAMLSLQTLNEIITRVSILETRIELQHNRLQVIEEKISSLEKIVENLLRTSSENLEDNKKIFSLLNEHIKTQDKDIKKLLYWLIIALLSTIGFGITFLLDHFIGSHWS